METIKEPITLQECKDKVSFKHFSVPFDKLLIMGTQIEVLEEAAELYNSDTIELYNRQCVRANDLNEENKTLKAELSEAYARAANAEFEYHKKCDELQNEAYRACSLQEENNRLKEKLEKKEKEVEKLRTALESIQAYGDMHTMTIASYALSKQH